ncbi:MAG: ACP S-malonyltransferase [Planctomycetes bacterium]|nr:ACP S-malonyltransferase [Planctomycetota bacterium]
MKGILADVHLAGDIEKLVSAMQKEPWTEYWDFLGMILYHFDDVGLTPTSVDTEIWLRCQAEQVVLITNNRNEDSTDSLETAIRTLNTPTSLPVFTIGNLARFQKNKAYADRV